ncbi:hypothetical protein C2S51_018503 [Perilla frutescens var. frutescens]|nr:hypothetical protein C2S51_018503 [Perilla frutescens var. frutescens]
MDFKSISSALVGTQRSVYLHPPPIGGIPMHSAMGEADHHCYIHLIEGDGSSGISGIETLFMKPGKLGEPVFSFAGEAGLDLHLMFNQSHTVQGGVVVVSPI